MNNKKNILITGATGFVGACLAHRLVKQNKNVNVVLRKTSNLWRLKDIEDKLNLHYADLTNRRQIDEVVKEVNPQIIFHLAVYGAYPFQTDAKKVLQANVFGTFNLLNACIKNGFDVFINTGSSSEYGTKNKPMSEENLLEPNSYYAVAKSAQTLLCQHLARDKNLPIITLRLFSVYGPYEEPTRLVPTLIKNCLQGQDLNLVSPKTARDFVFTEDVVDAYLKAARQSQLAGRVFNIGTGEQSTLKDIVSTVVKLTKTEVKQNWGAIPGRSFDTNIWVADISKTKELLKWQPKYSLESGLKKTINWFKKNKELYD